MSKIDIIDYCGDCSNRYYVGQYLKCNKKGHDDNVVFENKRPPEWCPLEDAKEPCSVCGPGKGYVAKYCFLCGRLTNDKIA